MKNNENRPERSDEGYCDMLRAHYERLKKEKDRSPSTNAIEEVKLRLFLSLLDRTRDTPTTERFSASPL